MFYGQFGYMLHIANCYILSYNINVKNDYITKYFRGRFIMMYFKKIMKVLTVALVVSVLLFSVINANAGFDPPIYTFIPFPSLLATVPPMWTNFSFLPLWTPAPTDTSSIVNFADPHLQNALATELGVGPNELTENYLASLAGTLDLSGYDIELLSGIEHLTNLDYLILRDNPISSKHELKRLRLLTGLEFLDISALSVTQLPSELGDMSNLTYLDISANRIDSLPSAFSDLNLDVLLCNYCFFDVTDPAFVSTIISATTSADYQYQLMKIDIYGICQTPGVVTIKWDEMPNIYFPNGAVAEVKRYSICQPNPNGNQGAWIDSEPRSSTSYTFEGLSSAATYSFDISVDYYIKNTIYDGKYVKFYEKELFQPIPQNTPTPSPTATLEPTPTVEVTNTPEVTQAPAVTSAPADIVTINPNQPVDGNGQANGSSTSSTLTILLVLVIVLIVAIVGLIIVLFVRMNKPQGPTAQTPSR